MNASKVTVQIDDEVIRRINGFTHFAKGEVAGLARTKIEDGLVKVWDLKLLPGQIVTAASVKLDDESLGIFLSMQEDSDEFKFMWHSHVNMGAFLSGTDENCIDSMLSTADYLISCVSTKDKKMLVVFDGLFHGLRVRQECVVKTRHDMYDDLEGEFKENVEEPCITEISSVERTIFPFQFAEDYGGFVSGGTSREAINKKIIGNNRKGSEDANLPLFVETENDRLRRLSIGCKVDLTETEEVLRRARINKIESMVNSTKMRTR